jgi:hypothetical protein
MITVAAHGGKAMQSKYIYPLLLIIFLSNGVSCLDDGDDSTGDPIDGNDDVSTEEYDDDNSVFDDSSLGNDNSTTTNEDNDDTSQDVLADDDTTYPWGDLDACDEQVYLWLVCNKDHRRHEYPDYIIDNICGANVIDECYMPGDPDIYYLSEVKAGYACGFSCTNLSACGWALKDSVAGARYIVDANGKCEPQTGYGTIVDNEGNPLVENGYYVCYEGEFMLCDFCLTDADCDQGKKCILPWGNLMMCWEG